MESVTQGLVCGRGEFCGETGKASGRGNNGAAARVPQRASQGGARPSGCGAGFGKGFGGGGPARGRSGGTAQGRGGEGSAGVVAKGWNDGAAALGQRAAWDGAL